MSEPEIPQDPSPVSDSWQQMVQAVLAVVLLAGAVAMFHYYSPVTAQSAQPDELHKQVQQLSQQVALGAGPHARRRRVAPRTRRRSERRATS